MQSNDNISKNQFNDLQLKSKELEKQLNSFKNQLLNCSTKIKSEIDILEREMLFFDEKEFEQNFRKLKTELDSDGNKESDEYKDKANRLRSLSKQWENYIHLKDLKHEKLACISLTTLLRVKAELYEYHKLFRLMEKLKDFDEKNTKECKDKQKEPQILKKKQEEIEVFLRGKLIGATDALYGDDAAEKPKEKIKEKGDSKSSSMLKNTLTSAKSFNYLGKLAGLANPF